MTDSDMMHRPRDGNGRFTTYVTMAEFLEFRRGLDQRFLAQEKAIDRAARAIETLTETHAIAHRAEHESNEKAKALESARTDDRLKTVEEGLVERVQALENANLVSATTAQVESVAKAARWATAGSVLAGLVSVLAGIVAIISIVGGGS